MDRAFQRLPFAGYSEISQWHVLLAERRHALSPHRDEGYQGPRSLSVNDSPFQFKFLLPDAVTGAAVGRNGSTVNAIKQQTGTFMQFCRYNSATTYPTERLLIFASPSVASAAAALRVLLDCLAAVPGALERLAPRPGSPELALRIVIPGHCAGAVMGPGGETIKALGARCGCHAAVEPRPPRAAFVPFRAVALAAPGPAALAAGAAEVMDLVTRDPRYAPGIQAVTSTCFRMLPVAERRVGALLGPAGAHIRALQDVLRVRMGVEDGADLAGVKHVSFWGPVENVDVAMRAVALATGQQRWRPEGDSSEGGGTPGAWRGRAETTEAFTQEYVEARGAARELQGAAA
uniref:K Homology domain-containing protein n=1 Tax=Auxenochlorella protothecoides TaxID=3075 RepID=A0A1D1ZZB9_AUXPR